jgi:hypothetical protein
MNGRSIVAQCLTASQVSLIVESVKAHFNSMFCAIVNSDAGDSGVTIAFCGSGIRLGALCP